MPKNLFPLDNTRSSRIEARRAQSLASGRSSVVSVKPGEVFRADCREWFDGAIKNDDSADDVRHAPLPGVHVLSGPFRVEGAQPGDLLIVDILEIDACDKRTKARSPVWAGATRSVRQDERRRVSHRSVPGCLQGDLGLHGRCRNFASHSRLPYVGIPPRSDGHRHRRSYLRSGQNVKPT